MVYTRLRCQVNLLSSVDAVKATFLQQTTYQSFLNVLIQFIQEDTPHFMWGVLSIDLAENTNFIMIFFKADHLQLYQNLVTVHSHLYKLTSLHQRWNDILCGDFTVTSVFINEYNFKIINKNTSVKCYFAELLLTCSSTAREHLTHLEVVFQALYCISQSVFMSWLYLGTNKCWFCIAVQNMMKNACPPDPNR